jgi:hypothetical protein
MPGHPQAHRDLGVEAQWIRAAVGRVAGDVGEV